MENNEKPTDVNAADEEGSKSPKAQPKLIPSSELDKMIAESLKDVSDEDDADVDVNDPELLKELKDITGPSGSSPPKQPRKEEGDGQSPLVLPTTSVETLAIIKQRIEMYEAAEARAQSTGEAAKSRRFERGLKTLRELLDLVTAGKAINMEDIPPEVVVKKASEALEDGDATEAAKTET